jgi:hypothetical protein
MRTQEDVLSQGPRGAARLIRDTFLAAGLSPERTRAADEPLHAVLSSGSTDAWKAACAAIWSDEALRIECDRHHGLRTVIRLVAIGTVMDAITDLLAQRCAGRREDANMIAVSEGHLWIADLQFRDLVYHLELNENGCGPAWDCDDGVRDLLAQPQGPQGLWRRWVTWAADGRAVRREFIGYPAYAGSFPAWGIPSASPRVKSLVAASRCALPAAAIVIVGKIPELLPWSQGRVATLTELIAHSCSDEARSALAFSWCANGYRRACELDPLSALSSMLSRTRQPTAAGALVALMRAAVCTLIPLGQISAPGILRIAWEQRPRLPPIFVTRSGERLLVNADGLAAVASWLGIFPYSYHRSGGPWTWSWETLSHCGWHGLEESDRWSRGRFDVDPGDAGAKSGWIAFSPGDIPGHVPTAPARARVIKESRPSTCDMSIG